jgi:branched-chain amino acid aminotransferase
MNRVSAEKVWKNGKLIDWEDATVHVASHALHYGTSWFEGIRCYKTSRGPEVFRLDDHIQRLFNSCKIYRTNIPFSEFEIHQAILETIRGNRFQECYIRPLVMRGWGTLMVNPLSAPVDVLLMAWKWGKYLGEEAIEQGVDVGTASWMRAAPNTLPSMAKAGGNYLNGGLVKMEAAHRGYAEGIALDTQGYVSEGSGENIFMVHKGRAMTPPLGSSILPGITRDSVIRLLRELGIETVEQQIPREMLYLAEEIFLTGTAAEVTPVCSVDGIVLGSRRGRGPVTTRLQKAFFDYVEGRVEDRFGWMTSVYQSARV